MPQLTPGSPASPQRGVILNATSWLQLEFRPRTDGSRVEALLGRIASNRSAGFAGSHRPQTRPVSPVPLEIRAAALFSAVPGPPVHALFFGEQELGTVLDGFTLDLPEVGFLYGVTAEDWISVLGLGILGPDPAGGPLEPITRLAATHDLLLVDWLGGQVLRADDEPSLRQWVAHWVDLEDVGETW